MAIEYVVESLDQVEESIRPAYTKVDGKYQFDADRYAELKAAGLKKKNSELLGKEKQLKEMLTRLERFKDVPEDDWDSYQEWKQAQADGGSGGNSGKVGAGDLEKAMAKEKARFERQLSEREGTLKEREARITELEARIRDFTIWGPVKDWAIENKVLPDRMEAFITLLKAQKRFDLDDDNNVIFRNADGTPTLQKPKEAFSVTLMNEFPWAFAASEAGGSGARNGTQGGRAGVDLAKLSATERMKLARETGKQ